jgi:hypothetical protein
MNEFGQAWVTVDDTELFDFVEDYLIESHGLEYVDVVVKDEPAKPSSYTMRFAGDLMSRIEAALAQLNPKEIHEIFLINNPNRPG